MLLLIEGILVTENVTFMGNPTVNTLTLHTITIRFIFQICPVLEAGSITEP
uniref:Uncharacterized protein n=1 Tax=Aliivibrio wodanis TaxID=80852 RepID=A0A5Q4YY41_9GAMM|nr:hypothetical protein AW0309160_01922 [Aliivibrio wodanis]